MAVESYRQIADELGLPTLACLAWEISDGDDEGSVRAATLAGLDVQLADVLVAEPTHTAPVDPVVTPVPESAWDALDDLASSADDFTTDGLREWFVTERLGMVRAGRAQIWGIMREGAPIAACFTFTSGSLSRVEQLLVHPLFRRRGLGSALVAGVRGRLRSSRIIVLEPEADTWRSRMYRDVGFESVGMTVTAIEREHAPG